jgi:protein-S-isoprenylcysteine O-methyltransferase Ste14
MNSTIAAFDFTLSRHQRFKTMLSVWWKGIVFLVFWVPFLISMFFKELIPAVVVSIVTLFFFRGLLSWTISLMISTGKTHVEIKENGIGVGTDKADWWVFADGIRKLKENTWGTTSIYHHNGAVIDIPTEELTEEAINEISKGMSKYVAERKKLKA